MEIFVYRPEIFGLDIGVWSLRSTPWVIYIQGPLSARLVDFVELRTGASMILGYLNLIAHHELELTLH